MANNISKTTDNAKHGKGDLLGLIIDHPGAAKNLMYGKVVFGAIVGVAKFAFLIYIISKFFS